jgi:NADPH-dependent 2,4-dienoyl-CoA reductase/sulfur reductase-like enzyme
MSPSICQPARRRTLRILRDAGLLALAASKPARGARAQRRLVVVGAGYGGATAARHAAILGGESVVVTLVERNEQFVSCPLSNLVLGGNRSIDEITASYDELAKRVRLVHDEAIGIDPERRRVRLARGGDLPYDRVILSPGIDFFFDRIDGLETAASRERCPHAWRAGPQIAALRHELQAMRDGGVFAISIPRAPYRCPPAPYERACQVAWYLRRNKPRSKVLVLDGNEDVQAQKALFVKAWNDEYRGIVEYRPDCVLTAVDAATRTMRFEVAEDVAADVLNVIPPHGAGDIARKAGAITANDRWCEVDFLTFESVKVPKLHVLGDAIQVAPLMAKAGQIAHQHAKVCVAAVLALLADRPVDDAPVLTNSCYSFVDDREAGHIKSVHRYDKSEKTFVSVPEAADVATTASARDGDAAFAWWKAIRADMLD